MKKLIFLLMLTFSTSVLFTSCREEKSGIEKAADDVEDAVDDVADDLD
ncbi:hypothetical protein [Gillisia limnaea]|uniref:Entericidin EcnAB n=1 Tax=Gillisia limnaea (strain DSM 15749 / LMG 21470 / R-8282) TaxID=865937 RepID=H2BWH7_GILLR|nr:hypothetical protein [Gillisia limnaea]EHQ01920.1 hypothetical protein Gilli_1252 [Gillisia limnaea DSM 15749]